MKKTMEEKINYMYEIVKKAENEKIKENATDALLSRINQGATSDMCEKEKRAWYIAVDKQYQKDIVKVLDN